MSAEDEIGPQRQNVPPHPLEVVFERGAATIASGTDPVTVLRRFGRGEPDRTLSLYAHLFGRSDEAAAKVTDEAMGLKEKRVFGPQSGINLVTIDAFRRLVHSTQAAELRTKLPN